MEFSCSHPKEFGYIHPNKPLPVPKDGVWYWHIHNFPETMDKYKVILAFEKAFNKYQRVFDCTAPLDVSISLQSTSDKDRADINISFGSGRHTLFRQNNVNVSCPKNFDGKEGVLAHAWSLISDKPFGGAMHFDSSEDWSDMFSDDSTNLLTTVLHELGHVFDFDHSEERLAVMTKYYSGPRTEFHRDDIEAIQGKIGELKRYIKNDGRNYVENTNWLKRFISRVFS